MPGGGNHPNSLANLRAQHEANRTRGGKHMITKENAREMAAKGVAARRAKRTALDAIKAMVAEDPERYAQVFVDELEKASPSFWNMLLMYTEAKPESNVNVKQKLKMDSPFSDMSKDELLNIVNSPKKKDE